MMLDAFIIERIRQRQGSPRGEAAQVPLRIEVPEPDPAPRKPEPVREERGIVIIDFTI